MKLDNVIAVRENKKIYLDGDKIIKVFESNYLKSDILNEALNQARVEETGLPVAKIWEVCDCGGKLAIVMDNIKGKTLAELIKTNPQKQDEYLCRFVDLQIKMHSYKAPLLNKLADKMDRKINESDLEDNIKYELHNRLGSMPKHKKLCHGDFNPSNIIVGDDGIDYIIDWAHATQGNASADVARTYLLFRLAGNDRMAEDYLNMFCEKSGTERQYVEGWLPIVAASQSVKSKPNERDFLLKWVDVIDFQ
ncbi:MAG: aminoglycoside phosphotransferase family protein [Clostridia bacterium]